MTTKKNERERRRRKKNIQLVYLPRAQDTHLPHVLSLIMVGVKVQLSLPVIIDLSRIRFDVANPTGSRPWPMSRFKIPTHNRARTLEYVSEKAKLGLLGFTQHSNVLVAPGPPCPCMVPIPFVCKLCRFLSLGITYPTQNGSISRQH